MICSRLFARIITSPFFDDFVGNSPSGFLCILRRLWRCFDREKLNIKAKHATWATATRNDGTVGKVFRNPEAALLSDHH